VTEPDGYEILVPPQFGSQAWVHLLRSCGPVGIACVGFDAIEHLEIAGGSLVDGAGVGGP
jgi:glycine cleavage system aminomethyltransferase T